MCGMSEHPQREASCSVRIERAEDYPEWFEVSAAPDGFGGHGPTEYPPWCVIVEMLPGLEMRPGSDAYARTVVTVKDGRWHVLRHEVVLKGDAATDENRRAKNVSIGEALRLVRETYEHEDLDELLRSRFPHGVKAQWARGPAPLDDHTRARLLARYVEASAKPPFRDNLANEFRMSTSSLDENISRLRTQGLMTPSQGQGRSGGRLTSAGEHFLREHGIAPNHLVA